VPVHQDGVELLIATDLANHTSNMYIDSRRFLLFTNLRARIELDNGLILGKAARPQLES
jgi:hypothetical protein